MNKGNLVELACSNAALVEKQFQMGVMLMKPSNGRGEDKNILNVLFAPQFLIGIGAESLSRPSFENRRILARSGQIVKRSRYQICYYSASYEHFSEIAG